MVDEKEQGKLEKIEHKIGETTISIDKKSHKLLSEVWEDFKRDKEDVIESESIFNHIRKVEEGIKQAEEMINSGADPQATDNFLQQLEQELNLIEGFTKHIEDDLIIKREYEKMVLELSRVLVKRLDNLRKEVAKLHELNQPKE